MLVSRVDFKVKAKRTHIKLDLLCSDMEIGTEFVKKLNNLRTEAGELIYKAEQGRWQQVKTIDPKFKGKVDVNIELLRFVALVLLKQAVDA